MRVDQEHLGLRLVVPLLTLLGCAGTYWIGLQLTAGDNSATAMVFIVLPAAIGVGLGVAWASERVIKRVWPSSRALTLNADSLTLRKRGATEAVIAWDRRINVLAWRFTVPPRRGRIPKGWYCMAVQLGQDETTMTLYTFFPPEEARSLAEYEQFAPLISRKEWEKASPAERLLMGEQTRLHGAEVDRWNTGAELAREDFAALVAVMRERIAGWAGGGAGARPALTDEPAEPKRPPSKGDGKPIQL